MSEPPQTGLYLPYSWQATQWQRLSQQALEGRLPHALMLVGPKGIGKHHLGVALGQFLLCQAPRDNACCGRCKACLLNLNDGHPDFLRLYPEAPSRVIRIDQIRALTDFVNKTAQQGGRKVILLEPAESLHPNAANALLKCLEEPSGATTLLLVSHHPSAVLATIRSRCQMQKFTVPAAEQALAWLRPLATGHDAQELLQAAAGAPLAAFSMLEGDCLSNREKLRSGLAALATGRQSPVVLAGELSKIDPIEYVELMMQWLQAGLRCRAVNDVPERSEGNLPGLLAEVPEKLLYRFWDKLVKIKRQILNGANHNKQLLLEELLLDWQVMLAQSR